MIMFFSLLKILGNHTFLGVGNTQKVYTTQLASVKLKTILHYIMLLKWFTFWVFPAPIKRLFLKIFEKWKISSTDAT